MIGIVSDGSNAKQRISRISVFKKNSYRLSVAAVLMLVVLGIIFLTNANEKERRGNSLEIY
jgi:bla regulator protein blaR1